MYRVMLALGVLCLVYFVWLMVKHVDFGLIWLPAGCLFLAVGGYGWHCINHPQGFRLPAPVVTAAGLVLALGLAAFVAAEGLIFREMMKQPEKELPFVIVLGAQVRGTVPSRALLRRLEAAEEYMRENPQTIAVLSGGQGSGEDITEARCMEEYLTAAGILKERLILEERSTTTEENLRFSAEKIAGYRSGEAAKDTAGKAGMDVRTGILSNNFHVYRALLLAKKMGYQDVSGIAAPSDWRLQIHYLVREFFALIKEKTLGHI